jgi:hypothetical protein
MHQPLWNSPTAALVKAMVVALAAIGPAAATRSGAGCAEGPQAPVRQLAQLEGFDAFQVPSKTQQVEGLEIMRMDPGHWRVSVVDMRDLRVLRAKSKNWTPPEYTLSELGEVTPNWSIITTAGMTLDYGNPIPAGLLVVDGIERSPTFRSSRILDGLVCISGNSDTRILSQDQGGKLRAAGDVSFCRHAVQAGPVLVHEGIPQGTDELRTSRVFLGVDGRRRVVIGHAGAATTRGLGCALVQPGIELRSAIALQGDTLGGILFSRSFRHTPTSRLGSAEETVASALLFQYSPTRLQVPSAVQRSVVPCSSQANDKCR